jgi:hypothetical protein
MKSEVQEELRSDALRPVAPPWHTAVVLIAMFVLAYRGHLRADGLRAMEHPDRIQLYLRTILFQWLTLGFVLFRLWLGGSSPFTVLGERWHSVREFFRDVLIGLLFLIATITVTSIFGAHDHAGDRATQFLLPQTTGEIAFWVAVSITAGVCEEAVYRGYLQRQFASFAKSVPVGIVLSGVVFGAAHSYQGLMRASMIGIMGILAGILAYWRQSVRPGMIAHVLQDLLGGFVRH